MKYCRYCGKTIDDDSSFCTHCGKNQDTQGAGTNLGSAGKVFSRFKEVIIGFIQSAGSKIKKTKDRSSSTDRTKIKKWAKRISLFVLALVVVGLIVLFGFWLYGFYQTSKWSKEDERREAIALKDISKADKIARELFEEYANRSHRYDFDDSECGFNHIERGIEIIRNAAEKGNDDAQFTLGCIYEGARYDSNYTEWDGHITMMDTEVDLERAAYWYNQAAIQGNPKAMGNLANSYRYGRGVEKDLFEATKLMGAAAEKGSAWAQLNYGDMFRDCEVWLKAESDDGGYYYAIPKKPIIDKAKEWWKKALDNKNANDKIKAKAKERLEKLYE